MSLEGGIIWECSIGPPTPKLCVLLKWWGEKSTGTMFRYSECVYYVTTNCSGIEIDVHCLCLFAIEFLFKLVQCPRLRPVTPPPSPTSPYARLSPSYWPTSKVRQRCTTSCDCYWSCVCVCVCWQIWVRWHFKLDLVTWPIAQWWLVRLLFPVWISYQPAPLWKGTL